MSESVGGELVAHLFFDCSVFAGLWSFILKWIGIQAAMQSGCWQHFIQFEELLSRDRTSVSKLVVIWITYVWTIWKGRNNKIFQNKEIRLGEMAEEVNILPWKWMHIKSGAIANNIVMWFSHHRACLGFIEE